MLRHLFLGATRGFDDVLQLLLIQRVKQCNGHRLPQPQHGKDYKPISITSNDKQWHVVYKVYL